VQQEEAGIEMRSVGDKKMEERVGEGETNYRPINWKRILFTPKYIRMYPLEASEWNQANREPSMAYSPHRYHRRDSAVDGIS